MTLPASGPLSISQIAAEFGIPLPCVFPRDFYGKPGVPSSGALSMSQFHGLSNVTFTPDGGAVVAEGDFIGTAQLQCNQPAVWTYTGGGAGGSVSIGSGASATAITFTVQALGTPQKPTASRTCTWHVTGVAAGVTRNFTVTVTGVGGF